MINLAVTAVLAFSVNAERYENREYGFSVEIARRPACSADPYQHDTGVHLFLDAGPADCGEFDEHPFISVEGSYNSSFQRSAKVAAEFLCHTGRPAAPPRRLRIDGQLSAACRIDGDDGWIDIVVTAQAGEWPGKLDPEDQSALINYAVTLHTTAARLDKDLAQLRSVLRSIRLFVPK